MKVFWNQGYSGPGRGQLPGEEVRVNCTFDWAGETWQVPSVFVCGQGLVVDLMRSVAWERMQRFIDKWNLMEKSSDTDFNRSQRRQISAEHPLDNHCSFAAEVNGRALSAEMGCGFTYMMALSEGDPDAMELMEHYGLDKNCAWSFYRRSFKWATARKPRLQQLTLTMTHDAQAASGPQFSFGAEKRLAMAHPVSGQEYVLHLYEESDVQMEDGDGWMKKLMYAVEPALPFSQFAIEDAGDGEIRQRWIGWLGALNENVRCAYSALYKEKPEKVIWQTLFHVKRVEDLRVQVL